MNHKNVLYVNFKRDEEREFTCDIYTYDQKKYRIVVQASSTTQAYDLATTEAYTYDVFGIRCVALFTQSPDNIDRDTQPAKVFLLPRDVARVE